MTECSNCNFIKKETKARVFSNKFIQFIKTFVLREHIQVSATVKLKFFKDNKDITMISLHFGKLNVFSMKKLQISLNYFFDNSKIRLKDLIAPISEIGDSIKFRKHPVQKVTSIQQRNVQLLMKCLKKFLNKCIATGSSLKVVDVAKYPYTLESKLIDQLKFYFIKNRVPVKTDQMPHKMSYKLYNKA